MKTLKEIKEIICKHDNLRERFAVCDQVDWSRLNVTLEYVRFTQMKGLIISEKLNYFSVQEGDECFLAVIKR